MVGSIAERTVRRHGDRRPAPPEVRFTRGPNRRRLLHPSLVTRRVESLGEVGGVQVLRRKRRAAELRR